MLQHNNEIPNNNPKKEYLRMRIRHANIAFYSLLAVTILSLTVSLTGIILLFKREKGGRLTSIGGFITTAAFVKLSKDANDRADKAMQQYLQHHETVD